MKLRLFRKLHDTAGQSLVEFALVLPLLVALVLGVYEYSRAIQANNIIINMSREGANLVSRTTSIDHQDIMNSLATTAQWLTMVPDGMMYITPVKGTAGGPQFQQPEYWEKNPSGPASKIDQSKPVADYLGDITVPSNEYAYIFEVDYTYRFKFLPIPPVQLHSTIIF